MDRNTANTGLDGHTGLDEDTGLDRPTLASTEPETPSVDVAPVDAPVDRTAKTSEVDEGPSLTLLERLDRRQTGVLVELDQLSEKVEHLIAETQRQRQQTRAAA